MNFICVFNIYLKKIPQNSSEPGVAPRPFWSIEIHTIRKFSSKLVTFAYIILYTLNGTPKKLERFSCKFLGALKDLTIKRPESPLLNEFFSVFPIFRKKRANIFI